MSKLEKDEERAKRLKEVYRYLFSAYGLESQSDFANNIKVQRTAMSAAMNGAKAYLTNNLFTKICAAYPGVFNLDYLLTGEGELLASNNDNGTKVEQTPAALDMSFLFEKAIDKITASNDKTIASMEAQVEKLEDIIKTKDKLIHILELRIRDLEFTINTMKMDVEKDSYHGSMSNFASEPTMPKK